MQKKNNPSSDQKPKERLFYGEIIYFITKRGAIRGAITPKAQKFQGRLTAHIRRILGKDARISGQITLKVLK